MSYIIIDRGVSPPIVVLETDDQDKCLEVAQKYASQAGRSVHCYASEVHQVDPQFASVVPPSSIPVLVPSEPEPVKSTPPTKPWG